MTASWLTVKQLAAALQISVRSLRRAYQRGDIPVERIRRFVRFDLERVKQAMQANGHGYDLNASVQEERRSATGGDRRRRAQPTSPRLGKTGASIARKPRRKK